MKAQICLMLIVLSAVVMAEEVPDNGSLTLNDGRRFNYHLVSADDRSLLVLIDGMRVQIPRIQVASVSPRQMQNAGVVQPNSGAPRILGWAEAQPQQLQPVRPAEQPVICTVPEVPGATGRLPEARLPIPADPAVAQALLNDVNLLAAANDPPTRDAAARDLTGHGDEGLAILATAGLYHQLPSVRSTSARLLGLAGGNRVLKQLIEAFYAAAEPTIPPYQVEFVGQLDSQISRLTQRDFSFFVRRSADAPRIANEMVQWWQQNWRTLPPQLGEPELNPNEPEYEANLRQVRQLHLDKRQFAGSNLPTEFVPETLVNSPAENQYVSTIPVMPSQNALILDRQLPPSLTPPVIKIPPPERDAPGEFRQQIYQERLRSL